MYYSPSPPTAGNRCLSTLQKITERTRERECETGIEKDEAIWRERERDEERGMRGVVARELERGTDREMKLRRV